MVSESVQIALIASAFPTVGIVVSSYFTYKANKKAVVKLDEIHELTNSAATKAADKIASLEKTIQGLIRKK